MIDVQVRWSYVVLLDSFFYGFTLLLTLKKFKKKRKKKKEEEELKKGSANKYREEIIYVKFFTNFIKYKVNGANYLGCMISFIAKQVGVAIRVRMLGSCRVNS